MLSCIIVDDEPKAIGIITRCIEKVPFLELKGSFRDGKEALLYLSNNNVDVLFLDINMPGTSGLDVARLTPPRTRIIFTTAFQEFALEGFELDAIDYLMKPVTFERFSRSISKLTELGSIKQKLNGEPKGQEISNKNSDFLLFKSGTIIHKINKEHILFFEKEGNYFRVYTREKTILFRMNFADLQKQIADIQFTRVHKSFIVNLKQIDRITSETLFIRNHEIPISVNYKVDLSQALKSFFA